MRAAFRADASAAIGCGHAMRCRVLAGELRRRGIDSLFLCAGAPDGPFELLERDGFPCRRLPPAASPEADADACAALLPPDLRILVVDHYALDRRWETPLRRPEIVLLAIDDLADRPHDCDVLLDQNLVPRMRHRYDDLVPPSCVRLLGPDFALLRDEFRAPPALAREAGRPRLLISFGGTDPANLTARTLREIEDLPLPADVVLGAAAPSLPEIADLCRRHPDRWTLHVQTRRMADLMARADLAVGAGGSSQWERCALGLPALVVAVADNQVLPSRLLAERGACRYLGECRDLKNGDLRRNLEDLLRDPATLAAMGRAARSLLPDAHGARRVADVLLQKVNP